MTTVAGRLGHAQSATTFNVYGHFVALSDRDGARVLTGLLDASTEARPASEKRPKPAR